MTRLMKLSLIPILLTGFSFLVAAQPPEPSAQLRNPKSGVSVTLPDGWEFQAMEKCVAGPDKGKGGKFLVLPPGYEGNVPDGYYVVPSKT